MGLPFGLHIGAHLGNDPWDTEARPGSAKQRRGHYASVGAAKQSVPNRAGLTLRPVHRKSGLKNGAEKKERLNPLPVSYQPS